MLDTGMLHDGKIGDLRVVLEHWRFGREKP